MNGEQKSGSLQNLLAGLLRKNEEMLRYLIVGALTTLLNYAVYAGTFLLAKGLPGDYQIANTVSFLVAVVFAYFANKKAVFRTVTSGAADALREAGFFFVMRLVSFGFDVGMMALLVDVWRADELLAKIPVVFVIVLLNYVFSKLYIFRKPEDQGGSHA